ncbi:ScyD/ScyE family protein [Dactylosporangium sp. NPDC049525]|uniref:ScyD/ScyE family protein n=1 Tax=Dactylosporangium sp. NPDC049525 TaxID=3154730 RepID=UPI003431BF84
MAAALVLAGAPAASAAEAEPSVRVIASGLDNPRGIAIGNHGWLYVAEAGRGGAGPCIDNGLEGERQCLGASAALTAIPPRLDRGAKPHRVVTGLPSLAAEDGSSAIGLHDISPDGPGLVATIGGAYDLGTRTLLGPGARLMGHVVSLHPGVRGGAVKPIADLNAYEEAKNPDQGDPGSLIGSNPYGILATPFGAFATDPGANDLLMVTKSGKISTAAVFHARMVPSPSPPPSAEIPMQAVPMTVTRGPDGALYVGELTGFPFVKGAARVWRIAPDQAPQVYATGFTNIIDIAFDRRGRLLVLQISKEGLGAGDPNGALIRVDVERGAERTELAEGKLTSPGGVAVGADGAIYVTNKSIFAGGGEVLRIYA